MYTYLKPLFVRETLLQMGLRLFTPEQFHRVFHTSPFQTKYFLETQAEAGNLLLRLKKGVYMLKTDPPSEMEIANALYKPSYISFEYALAYHNILPEMPYIITSATSKPTRLFTNNNRSFAYYTIKKPAFTGYSLLRREMAAFLIAEPEKALIDYLYFVSLGERSFNDRLRTHQLDRAKLEAYAALYERDSLVKLLHQTYDQQ